MERRNMTIVRNASIIFVCTMAGNVANYFFQFIMGRSLSLEDFGTMNALLSLISGITLPASAIMIVIAKYASTYTVTGEDDGLNALYQMSLKRISLMGVAVSAVFILISGPLRAYLRVDNISALMILPIGIFGSFLMTVNLGMLQGLQRFYYFGAGLGLGGVLRLALGMAFLIIGLRLNGAILATVLPTVLIFAITVAPLSAYLKGSSSYRHERLIKYSVPVLVSSSAFAFISNIDLIMAKHFFDPRDAGIYAATAVIGKTLLYLPSSFALAVFPMVAKADIQNGDSFKILDRALLCTICLCGAGLAAFAVAPGLIVKVLFGANFAPAAGFLEYYGVSMALLSVLSILISFNLARGKTAFVYSLAGGGAMMVAAVNVFHSSIEEVILSVAAVFFFVTAFNLWLVYRERHIYYREKNYALIKAADAANPD